MLLTSIVDGIPGTIAQLRIRYPYESEDMNNQFDELTKRLAQSVTRRAALKKFGIGLAGMALACFGLANKAEAKGGGNGCRLAFEPCASNGQCCSGVCLKVTKGSNKGTCIG